MNKYLYGNNDSGSRLKCTIHVISVTFRRYDSKDMPPKKFKKRMRDKLPILSKTKHPMNMHGITTMGNNSPIPKT